MKKEWSILNNDLKMIIENDKIIINDKYHININQILYYYIEHSFDDKIIFFGLKQEPINNGFYSLYENIEEGFSICNKDEIIQFDNKVKELMKNLNIKESTIEEIRERAKQG
jgi:hypothetical protein